LKFSTITFKEFSYEWLVIDLYKLSMLWNLFLLAYPCICLSLAMEVAEDFEFYGGRAKEEVWSTSLNLYSPWKHLRKEILGEKCVKNWEKQFNISFKSKNYKREASYL